MRLLLLAFVVGCWLWQQQAALPSAHAWWIGWGSAAVLIGALMLRGRRTWWCNARWGLAIALVVLTAFGWAAWRAELRMERWLPPELMGRDVVVEGIVAGLPDEADHGTRFRFDVERSDGETAALARGSTLLLTWREPAERLQPGQRHRLTVRLRRPRGLANPHGFDYAYWLLAEGIDATGYVRDGMRDSDGGAVPWGVRIEMWRAALRDRLRAAMPADARYGSVLIALVIGDQRGIDVSDWEIFRRTGISHLVSISGLHITMIAGATGALARGLWRRSFGMGRILSRPLPLVWPTQKAALVVMVLTALGYGLIAGMQIPALRTVTMLSVAAVALWSGRSPPVSVVLAWAAGVAVAIDPWAVMSPGFWLSFGAVAVIFFHARKEGERAQDQAGSVIVRWTRRAGATLADAARAQWAVTVGLVPLTLLLFGQVSVVSSLANAVAIPVVSLLVTPLALVGAVLPGGVAGLLLGLAHTMLEWLVRGLTWLAAPSWAVWEAAQPGWIATGLAIAGVTLLLMPRDCARRPSSACPATRERRRGHGHGVPKETGRRIPRWAGGLLMLPMLLAGRASLREGEMRITALDVGQGTAVLVETQRHALLYDAGPAHVSGSSAGAQVIAPFLRATGVRKLDVLMVSHEDADHAGGVLHVTQAVQVGAMLTASPPDHKLLEVPGKQWEPCVAGAGWQWDGVRFDILHPSEGDLSQSRLSSNARSCVLRVATAHRSLLLTGDIGAREELGLIDRVPPDQLRADILLVPHHGSATSSHTSFLRAVEPTVAIFQLGFANRYRHPREDVWRRYKRAGIARYRSDETGAVSIVTHGAGLEVVPYRQRNRRYWRDAPAAPR